MHFKSEADYIPMLPLLGIPPGNERSYGWQLHLNLSNIQHYTRNFECSVRLVDHIDILFKEKKYEIDTVAQNTKFLEQLNIKNNIQILYNSWISMAARDAAMTIYHFYHLMHSIRHGVVKIPSILDLVDVKKLENADEAYEKFFPNARLIRNAVAHEAERASDKKNIQKKSFTGSYQAPSINIEGSRFTMTIQSGRTLIMTWNKKIVEISIDEESLDNLIYIKNMINGAFDKVFENLKGKDLGD